MNSLNFEVPMEPEANEVPKGLVLGRDENIHIRLTRSMPLGDVGSYSFLVIHDCVLRTAHIDQRSETVEGKV